MQKNFNINLITSGTTKMGDLGDFQKNVEFLGIRRILLQSFIQHEMMSLAINPI